MCISSQRKYRAHKRKTELVAIANRKCLQTDLSFSSCTVTFGSSKPGNCCWRVVQYTQNNAELKGMDPLSSLAIWIQYWNNIRYTPEYVINNFLLQCLPTKNSTSTVFLSFSVSQTRWAFLTSHAFRGWERGGRGWSCSTRCCFHIASDSEPLRHASGSYHSIGCALEKTTLSRIIPTISSLHSWGKVIHTTPHIYHPVFILLWSVMHGCVPGTGAAGVNLAYIKHPVSGFKEENKLYCCVWQM